MKRILLSTAILGAAAIGATGAVAQGVETFRAAPESLEIRGTDFIGMRVYASETAIEGNEFEGLQDGWEDVGEISDIILDREGAVQAVLVDIGGFLGIGERRVAVSMEALRFVGDSATAQVTDDYYLVVNATRQALEGAPDYGAMDDVNAADAAAATDDATGTTAAAAAAAAATTAAGVEGASADTAGTGVGTDPAATDVEMGVDDAEAATATTETEMEADDTVDAAADDSATTETVENDDGTTVTTITAQPAEGGEAAAGVATIDGAEVTTTGATGRTPVAREGYLAAETSELTADDLQGATVYDANDERIGDVGELLLTADGQVTDVIVDVGGFLGIGAKPVSLGMGEVDVLRQDGGSDVRVYLSRTREELEALPTYEG